MSDFPDDDPLLLAQAVLSDPAMDQALTWLIQLETADAEQHRLFLDWLDESPAHRAAFDQAEAAWNAASRQERPIS